MVPAFDLGVLLGSVLELEAERLRVERERLCEIGDDQESNDHPTAQNDSDSATWVPNPSNPLRFPEGFFGPSPNFFISFTKPEFGARFQLDNPGKPPS